MFMASDKDTAKNSMMRKLYPLVTNTMCILTLGTVPIISCYHQEVTDIGTLACFVNTRT